MIDYEKRMAAIEKRTPEEIAALKEKIESMNGEFDQEFLDANFAETSTDNWLLKVKKISLNTGLVDYPSGTNQHYPKLEIDFGNGLNYFYNKPD